MATTKKRTVITSGPEGVTATRTTHRDYTHTVWARVQESKWRNDIEKATVFQIGQASKYNDCIESGEYPKQWDGQGFTAISLKTIRTWIDNCLDRVRSYEKELAAGYDASTFWHCRHWCGRYDLAAKQATALQARGYDTFIGEVQQESSDEPDTSDSGATCPEGISPQGAYCNAPIRCGGGC